MRVSNPHQFALVILVAVCTSGGDEPREHSAGAGLAVVARAAANLPSEDWSRQARLSIENQEYNPSITKAGLQAPNRAQGLRSYFLASGLEVVPRAATGSGWSWKWKTVAWGREGLMRAAPVVVPSRKAVRVTYDRPEFIEWYENGHEGLEQGFILARRPPGRGTLRIEGLVEGGLLATLASGGSSIAFHDNSGRSILRYGGLVARDATGRCLHSEFRLSGPALALVIDDSGAQYPLDVDPLLAASGWNVAGGQALERFGLSVATAGDVNGDGYSDVIVAAPSYDDGHPGAGRVALFLGGGTGLSISPAWSATGVQASASFGASAAAAGDVNADGYGDVIIGAPGFDADQTDEGAAFLYLGSSGGLGSTPGWSAQGNQDSSYFGASVAWAGDVNGDGRADVVVGAPGYTAGEPHEGAAFLYHGSGSSLSTVVSWTAEGNQAGANLGASVATAGDVNGDGYADVIVGVPRYTSTSTNEGAAFVFLGSATGLGAPGDPSNADWSAFAAQDSAGLGTSVATAGDVNGDGFADVILGAPRYDGMSVDEGAALAFLGSATGLGAPGNPGNADWSAGAIQGDAELGASVASAGDVNGDGYADVIVGAPKYDAGQVQEGAALVFLGSAAGLGPAGTPANADWTAESDQNDAQLGTCVATAGDVNGDGYSDVIVGAPVYDAGVVTDAGEAIVYLGSSRGPTLNPDWSASDFLSSAQFGFCVSSAGDINGDGYSDVVVGAVGYDGGQINEGAAFLYLGSPTGLASSFAWSAEGNQSNALFGNSVSTAGDVNGDGYSDVVVGAPLQTGGQTEEGRIFLYYGSATGLGTTPWTFESNRAAARLGIRVAAAGDVNGDGYGDFIAGAYTFGLDVSAPTGRVYVFMGAANGPTATPWTKDGDQDFSEYGYSVASAGDVNGDGFSDVLVGARRYSNGQVNEGRAYLYLGSASGLAGSHAWFGESDQDSAEFGYRLASAGDVNGDGYSDIAIGAPFYDNGQYNEGRVLVYLGSASGLGPNGTPANADWSVESDQIQAELGSSVAAAGDVNGDGFGDLIVGAPRYDNGGQDEGRAFVYYGSNTGLGANGTPANADWSAEGGQVGARFGISVACASDVNGDGFPDLVVGADLYDKSMAVADNGEALVFYGNGAGLGRLPRQARADNTALLAPLGKSDAPLAFRLKALGRTPAGRDRIRLEWQISPLTLPFDATGFGVGSWLDTGTPMPGVGSAISLDQLVMGRASGSVHHWRLRIAARSPFFPRTPWFSPPYNSPTETDLRTGGVTVGVESTPSAAPNAARLRVPNPNPLSSGAALITYELPRSGRVVLAIYDVRGRKVATLSDRVETAGRHTAIWHGTSGTGVRVAGGLYFARLEYGGQTLHEKIVVVR